MRHDKGARFTVDVPRTDAAQQVSQYICGELTLDFRSVS
jgi:hypothetical protein